MKRRRKLWHFNFLDLIQQEVKKAPTAEMKLNNLKNYLIANGDLIYFGGNISGDIEVIKLQGIYYCLDKTKNPPVITEFNDKSIAIDYAKSISKVIYLKLKKYEYGKLD
jgi:ASC-1-like (ASCH) protein